MVVSELRDLQPLNNVFFGQRWSQIYNPQSIKTLPSNAGGELDSTGLFI